MTTSIPTGTGKVDKAHTRVGFAVKPCLRRALDSAPPQSLWSAEEGD